MTLIFHYHLNQRLGRQFPSCRCQLHRSVPMTRIPAAHHPHSFCAVSSARTVTLLHLFFSDLLNYYIFEGQKQTSKLLWQSLTSFLLVPEQICLLLLLPQTWVPWKARTAMFTFLVTLVPSRAHKHLTYWLNCISPSTTSTEYKNEIFYYSVYK